MRIAVYSDLHSNAPSLERMVASAGQVDLWIGLGDSVGLFPFVNEVLDWERNEKAIVLIGDHEEALLRDEDLPQSRTATDSIRRQSESISWQNRRQLEERRSLLEMHVEGLRLRMSHFLDDRARIDEHKYELDSAAADPKFDQFDIVLFGNTHLPTIIHSRGTVFVNPGSAGFPVSADPRCSFVILDTLRRRVTLEQFEYDPEPLIAEIAACGYSERLSQYLTNGHRWPE